MYVSGEYRQICPIFVNGPYLGIVVVCSDLGSEVGLFLRNGGVQWCFFLGEVGGGGDGNWRAIWKYRILSFLKGQTWGEETESEISGRG